MFGKGAGDIAVFGGRHRAGTGVQEAGHGLDTRRALQLALAGLWVLDAVLQYQPFMYSRAFAGMLAGTADGNPPVIARPITWDAALVALSPMSATASAASPALPATVSVQEDVESLA